MKSLCIRIGNFLFHHRNRIFPVFMIVGVLVSRPSFPGGSYEADLWLDMGGLLVCIVGQALRVATIGFDYIKRGGKNQQIYADRLVDGGMFAHSRNPLYLGNMLMFTGLVMVLNAHIAYWVGLPVVYFTYICIILAEEQYLRGKFGATYDAYCGRVNRLWPDLRGFSNSVKDMQFNWARVVVKEYSTTFAWIIFALILRAWSLYYVQGSAAWPEIRLLALGLVPVVPIYLLVRYLKLSKKLQDKSPSPSGPSTASAGD